MRCSRHRNMPRPAISRVTHSRPSCARPSAPAFVSAGVTLCTSTVSRTPEARAGALMRTTRTGVQRGGRETLYSIRGARRTHHTARPLSHSGFLAPSFLPLGNRRGPSPGQWSAFTPLGLHGNPRSPSVRGPRWAALRMSVLASRALHHRHRVTGVKSGEGQASSFKMCSQIRHAGRLAVLTPGGKLQVQRWYPTRRSHRRRFPSQSQTPKFAVMTVRTAFPLQKLPAGHYSLSILRRVPDTRTYL
ncbi:hypothetical protein OH77DRAFT_1216700 [Trametes cingulata]|nr:hypothetical protein OH77DRAFT_1216700 [Trametes cingulata]